MKERGIMTGSFKDLIVWQRVIELSLAIYKLTAAFPPSEQFGLTNQLRRAAVSIASNIAEGYGRASTFNFSAMHVAQIASADATGDCRRTRIRFGSETAWR
jgi:hypothetical protein